MARSGAFSTTAYSNRCVDFNWNIAEQSISGNYTIINWNIAGGGSASGYYKAAPFTVVIDGEQVYYSETRIQLRQGTIVASGQKTIYHNADGSRSFGVSVTAAIYTYAVNCSGSGSWSIDSIPRAATITGADSITDEGNPSFTFSNPAGFNLEARLEINPVNTHLFSRSIANTGSYTFNLTDTERATLRSYLANTNSATLRYLLYSNDGAFVSYVDKTINVVNATPTFTSSVNDTGGASTALTGSTAGNVSMIKGFNYMSCSMVATAHKGASITKCKITNGSNAVEAAAADFNNTESNVFKFEVWDSRGNYNTYTQTISMIDYVPLTCNVDGKILLSASDSTKANVTFTIQGNHYNGSFGAVANSLSLDYTLADEDGNTIATDSAEATLHNNTYSVDINIDGLDYRNRYIVYVAAADAIKSIQASSKTLKATPVFDWGESDFRFNVPVVFAAGYTNTAGVSLIDDEVNNDYIVEQGERDGWFYRKWAGGFAECWKVHYQDGVNAAATNYNGFYYSPTISVPYPFTFTNLPTVTVDGGSTSNMNFVRVFGNYADAASFVVVGLANVTSTNITVSIRAIGRWK